MKSSWRMLGLAVAVGLSGCEPLDDLDQGGGGTGGTAFTRGFVFVRDGSTGRNVYAVDDAGDPNSPLRLTTQGGAYYPTVARSGRLVAFVHKVNATTFELQTVPTTGQGQPSTVFSSTAPSCGGCSNFRYPTFSPDGLSIVFTMDKGGLAVLAKVSTDGRVFQQLTNGSPYVYGSASFMPDGKSVIAAGGYSQLDNLIQVNLETGVGNVVSSGLGNAGAMDVLSRVAVSPDGKKVAFDARTTSGSSRVFVGQIDTSSQVSGVTQVTEKAGSQDSYPSWRGNVELGFLSDDGGNDNIYRVNASSVRGSGNLVLSVPVALEPSYGGPESNQ